MFKKIFCVFAIAAIVMVASACVSGGGDEKGAGEKSSTPEKFTLMLDYMPNTNHTGIYVAEKNGYFAAEGLNIEIAEPGDNTVSMVVASGKADAGISYQEDVTYARAAAEPVPIRAIATICQHNTSGFASAANKNLRRPRDFNGKTYAGWGAKSEEAVIRAVVDGDGGNFSSIKIISAGNLGYEALEKNVDFEWIFYGWDGILASEAGVKLNYLPITKYDERLNYYTPLFIASEEKIAGEPEELRRFLRAVSKGYEFAASNPREAAEILNETLDMDLDTLAASQEFLSEQYLDEEGKFGKMKDSVWEGYTSFMVENKLIEKTIATSDCWTNELLD